MLSPTRTRSSGIWERMRSEKGGGVLRRGTNCLASVQSSQRRLSQSNYIQLKNRLVDFIVADSVGYMVGYKGITRWTPAHYKRWIAQRLVRGGSGRVYSTSCLAP
jgi:hypothetical protein